MQKILAALTVATVVVGASSASAARYYEVQLTGTLVSELGYEPWQLNTGIDPTFSVGDKFSLTARFEESQALDFNGGKVAGLYGFPTTGSQFWRVDAKGLTWRSTDDTFDGFPLDIASGSYALPAIFFSGGKVTGLAGELVGPSTRPVLQLASFRVEPGEGLYGNLYNSQGFQGVWDFSGSSVTLSGVPEPAAWAMMIVGFGLAGATLRRRTALKPA
ncbi:PEPxxWA-CTERM sorting domain-containing protein [Phenylobacterium sp.]|uniref:PEPxxWA-CTERM sorting domain-containing protein n=1 Tax=Phenylobacterium sp. TaxID=1871053 RepID=UPI0035B2F3B5